MNDNFAVTVRSIADKYASVFSALCYFTKEIAKFSNGTYVPSSASSNFSAVAAFIVGRFGAARVDSIIKLASSGGFSSELFGHLYGLFSDVMAVEIYTITSDLLTIANASKEPDPVDFAKGMVGTWTDEVLKDVIHWVDDIGRAGSADQSASAILYTLGLMLNAPRFQEERDSPRADRYITPEQSEWLYLRVSTLWRSRMLRARDGAIRDYVLKSANSGHGIESGDSDIPATAVSSPSSGADDLANPDSHIRAAMVVATQNSQREKTFRLVGIQINRSLPT